MSPYPTINWVTQGDNFNDYRPAIGPDGQTVVFERTLPNTLTKLYQVTSLSGGVPEPILPNLDGSQTRVDWCWQTGQLAFEGTDRLRIMGAGSNSSEGVPNTEGFIYPQWNSEGDLLAVMNTSDSALPAPPCISIIDALGGEINYPNVIGNDANGTPMYGGMPAVNELPQIAFAGQPALGTWNPATDSPAYNQDNNYIFLNKVEPFSSSPLEKEAPLDHYDARFHGRAPAFSPDRSFIVFESTRNGGSFALFLFNLWGTGYPVQLTDPVYQAQHAKFFPDGNRLIFCAKPTPDSDNRIAWIDITAYLVS